MRFSMPKRLFMACAALIFGGGLVTSEARADVVSELSLQSDSFLSPAYDAANQSTFQFIGASFKDDPIEPGDFHIDLKAGYAVGAPLLSYINLKEFSYEMKVGDRQTFTVGRNPMRWSELDRRWNFGLIEPVFEWNPLSPESQGLTGLFWQVAGDGYKLALFGSYFFVPDQGPSFQINDQGQFERGNPWFRQPPSSIRILKENTPIEYSFRRPSETEIVLQSSYGLKLDIGDEGPWRARFAMLYKPMNSLALGYSKGIADIPTDRALVEIQPKVAYHNVRSVDFAYLGGRVSTGVSAAYDAPSKDRLFEANWNAPEYSDATLVSPWIDIRLFQGWKLSLQRIDVFGGEVTETGPDAEASRAPINSRYAFRQANQISLEIDRRLFKSRRLLMTTSYTKSDKNKFDLFRWQGRVELSRLWSVHSELQLVNAESVQTKESRNDIAEYANNDRILVGVGYVF